MTHDTLALIVTILFALLSFLASIAYEDIRRHLRKVETNHRLLLTVVYHLATGTEIPEAVKKKLELEMVNGKKE